MLTKLAASVISNCCRSRTTGLILNGKWSLPASSIEFHSFMTIMHTCLILKRQKTIRPAESHCGPRDRQQLLFRALAVY